MSLLAGLTDPYEGRVISQIAERALEHVLGKAIDSPSHKKLYQDGLQDPWKLISDQLDDLFECIVSELDGSFDTPLPALVKNQGRIDRELAFVEEIGRLKELIFQGGGTKHALTSDTVRIAIPSPRTQVQHVPVPVPAPPIQSTPTQHKDPTERHHQQMTRLAKNHEAAILRLRKKLETQIKELQQELEEADASTRRIRVEAESMKKERDESSVSLLENQHRIKSLEQALEDALFDGKSNDEMLNQQLGAVRKEARRESRAQREEAREIQAESARLREELEKAQRRLASYESEQVEVNKLRFEHEAVQSELNRVRSALEVDGGEQIEAQIHRMRTRLGTTKSEKEEAMQEFQRVLTELAISKQTAKDARRRVDEYAEHVVELRRHFNDTVARGRSREEKLMAERTKLDDDLRVARDAHKEHALIALELQDKHEKLTAMQELLLHQRDGYDRRMSELKEKNARLDSQHWELVDRLRQMDEAQRAEEELLVDGGDESHDSLLNLRKGYEESYGNVLERLREKEAQLSVIEGDIRKERESFQTKLDDVTSKVWDTLKEMRKESQSALQKEAVKTRELAEDLVRMAGYREKWSHALQHVDEMKSEEMQRKKDEAARLAALEADVIALEGDTPLATLEMLGESNSAASMARMLLKRVRSAQAKAEDQRLAAEAKIAQAEERAQSAEAKGQSPNAPRRVPPPLSSRHSLKKFPSYTLLAPGLGDSADLRRSVSGAYVTRQAEGARGVVTLVFTDVQGSTALWEAYGSAMDSAVQSHNERIRSLLGQYSGYEVKTEGDSFMAAFASVEDAFDFSQSVQLALLDVSWPPNILEAELCRPAASDSGLLWRGLRVRIGMHTGKPLLRKDPRTGLMDYFGPVVNRAARVAAAAHGGQVVASESSYKALRRHLDRLGVHVHRKPLGVFLLRGLSSPETVTELLPIQLSGRVFPPYRGEAIDVESVLSESASRLVRRAELEARLVHVDEINAGLRGIDLSDIPEEFIDPIRLSLMVDPVRASDGHCYERAALDLWLIDHNTSPMTEEPFEEETSKADADLQKRIAVFRDWWRDATISKARAAALGAGGEAIMLAHAAESAAPAVAQLAASAKHAGPAAETLVKVVSDALPATTALIRSSNTSNSALAALEEAAEAAGAVKLTQVVKEAGPAAAILASAAQDAGGAVAVLVRASKQAVPAAKMLAQTALGAAPIAAELARQLESLVPAAADLARLMEETALQGSKQAEVALSMPLDNAPALPMSIGVQTPWPVVVSAGWRHGVLVLPEGSNEKDVTVDDVPSSVWAAAAAHEPVVSFRETVSIESFEDPPNVEEDAQSGSAEEVQQADPAVIRPRVARSSRPTVRVKSRFDAPTLLSSVKKTQRRPLSSPSRSPIKEPTRVNVKLKARKPLPESAFDPHWPPHDSLFEADPQRLTPRPVHRPSTAPPQRQRPRVSRVPDGFGLAPVRNNVI